MGYSTNFTGALKFKNELSAKHIAYMKKFLGEDRREIGYEDDKKAYATGGSYWYHLDIELTEELDGLQWNGSEKTYDMPHLINFVLTRMIEKFPDFDFSMTGKIAAQGQEVDDRWEVVFEKEKAIKRDVKVKGTFVRCTECEAKIIIEECEVIDK